MFKERAVVIARHPIQYTRRRSNVRPSQGDNVCCNKTAGGANGAEHFRARRLT